MQLMNRWIKNSYQILKVFIKKIRLNKLSSVVTLFSNNVEEVKDDLHQIYIQYIRGSNEISSTPNLNKLSIGQIYY